MGRNCGPFVGEENKKVGHQLLLWISNYAKKSRSCPARSSIDQLINETEIRKEEFDRTMNDGYVWKETVRIVCPRTII